MDRIVDAHHHLWRYDADEYAWINADMAALKRDFLPEDLVREMGRLGICGSVAVQARQTVEETRWLLRCSEARPEILGVVGWVPLMDERFVEQLADLAIHPKLCGVRHVVQDEPEDDFVLRPEFSRGIGALKAWNLTYDLLVRASQLPAAAELVEQHPEQVFVLDHLAKPAIRTGATAAWEKDFRALAKLPNVCCKLSGLVTEADWSSWTVEQIEPYLDIALDAFGARRLMAGSDWPVCLLASTYARWWSLLLEWSHRLPTEDRLQILSGTATRVYGLDELPHPED